MRNLLILFLFVSCSPIWEKELLPDYKFWQLINVDTDGTRNEYKILSNRDYSNARTLEDIFITCESTCVSIEELDADNYLISLCEQDNKGRLFPSGIGAGYVTDGCGTAFCQWTVPKADFLPPNLDGYQWFTMGQGQQEDTYYFNAASLTCGTVPIEIANFKYIKVNDNYIFSFDLLWADNVDYIAIEGSNDGKNWKEVVRTYEYSVGYMEMEYRR